MARSFELWKERKSERMRAGKNAVHIVKGIPSDSEIRIALVPLTDAEHQNALERAASMVDIPDTQHGILAKDRIQQKGVLLMAAREVDDPTRPFFETFDEISQLDLADINVLWDEYQEMMFNFSPSIEALSPEEFEEVKKAFQRVSWNDLSGSAWYALKRFLLTIGTTPPPARSHGSSSTSNLTTNNEEEEFTQASA